MTNPTSRTDLHLVIRRASDGDTLEAGPFTYSAAVERWHELRAAAVNPNRDLYAVRSMDDPKFSHLAPRLYGDLPAAAKALARRITPKSPSRVQHRELWFAIGGDARMGGWWKTASRARQLGYLATVPGHSYAYITTLADTLIVVR